MFMCGSLSESHYVVIALCCLLLALSLSPLTAVVVAAPGLAVAFLPRFYVGDLAGSAAALQWRYTICELLLFGAAVAIATNVLPTTRENSHAPLVSSTGRTDATTTP